MNAELHLGALTAAEAAGSRLVDYAAGFAKDRNDAVKAAGWLGAMHDSLDAIHMVYRMIGAAADLYRLRDCRAATADTIRLIGRRLRQIITAPADPEGREPAAELAGLRQAVAELETQLGILREHTRRALELATDNDRAAGCEILRPVDFHKTRNRS